MLKWYKELYVDGPIGRKKKKVINALKRQKVTYHIFVVTLASNSENLFDILDANELLFPHYKKIDHYIIGVMSSKESAIELLISIIEQYYKTTGQTNFREMFAKEEFTS